MTTSQPSSPVMELDRLMSEVVAGLKAALPQMMRERDELQKKLSELTQQIIAAEQMIRAFGGVTTVPAAPTPSAPHVIAISRSPIPLKGTTPSGRVPAGQVFDHVEKIMQDGKARGLGAMKAELKRVFGIDYASSSLYRALRLGLEEKRYENKDKKWVIRAKK